MIGGADGNGIGLAEPALADTVLAWSRIGKHACPAGFDFDDRGAKRAGNFVTLRTIQRQFSDDAAVAADYGSGGLPP